MHSVLPFIALLCILSASENISHNFSWWFLLYVLWRMQEISLPDLGRKRGAAGRVLCLGWHQDSISILPHWWFAGRCGLAWIRYREIDSEMPWGWYVLAPCLLEWLRLRRCRNSVRSQSLYSSGMRCLPSFWNPGSCQVPGWLFCRYLLLVRIQTIGYCIVWQNRDGRYIPCPVR